MNTKGRNQLEARASVALTMDDYRYKQNATHEII
jgi:hypothetical protein